MATYLQWAKSSPVRRVTWVCGPEAALVRQVVAAHREDAPPDQCASVFAGDVPEREIWDLLLSCPPPGGRRMVVYGAEKLRNWDALEVLAGDPSLETACAVFVSAEPDFARGDGGAMLPHLAVLQASRNGQLIRCCAPSAAEDRVRLVASWWPGASLTLAHDVLTRCGSLEGAWQACELARRAGLAPRTPLAAVVCPAEAGGELADYLMAGNRRRAAALAAQAGAGEAGALVGLLAARLAAVEQIAEGVRSGQAPREAAGRLRVDRFVAGKVIPYLGLYPADRIRRLRGLLADCEAAWRAGARTGVTESLVALW